VSKQNVENEVTGIPEQKQPCVSEWCLQEIKAHCEAIRRDGKTVTIHRVKLYAFLESQTWGVGYIEVALHMLYPEQFPPYEVDCEVS